MKTSAKSGEGPLDKTELVRRLNNLASHPDRETAHGNADELLLQYIGDNDVNKAFHKISKWYA